MENDNEYDFGEFDNLVEYLKEMGETPSVRILRPNAVQSVIQAYEAVKKSVRHSRGECSISYSLHEPFDNVGSVQIVGSDITIKNTEVFMKAVLMADNFEIYAKTDGTVQLNLTFCELTK